jgi:hypothetical protein
VELRGRVYETVVAALNTGMILVARNQQKCVATKADGEASWRGSVPGNLSAMVNRKREA